MEKKTFLIKLFKFPVTVQFRLEAHLKVAKLSLLNVINPKDICTKLILMGESGCDSRVWPKGAGQGNFLGNLNLFCCTFRN